MKKKDYIKTILKNWFETEKLVSLWNNYCSEHDMEDSIHDNDEYELNEMFSGPSGVSDALRACCYGEYSFTDAYFILDGYGNLKSFGDMDVDEYVNFDNLADFLIDEADEDDKQEFIDDNIDELEDAFRDYYQVQTVDVYEDSLDDYNLLDDDWDEIIEEIKEKS